MDSMDKPPSFLHIYALSRVAKARCQGCCPRIWIWQKPVRFFCPVEVKAKTKTVDQKFLVLFSVTDKSGTSRNLQSLSSWQGKH